MNRGDVILVRFPQLLERITVNPNVFGGKPIIRGRRQAVEHVLGMLAGKGRHPDVPCPCPAHDRGVKR